jgi:hypothetical protein
MIFFFFFFVHKVATVDKCSDCVADKCKTSFATECGSAAVVSSNCNTSGDDTDNQFTCTIEQAFKG